MTDPVAERLRGERAALLRAAPPPHAARLWHEARRRRASSLGRCMSAAGWLVRLVIAGAALASFVAELPGAWFLLLLCALSLWLTRGACAPIRHSPKRGTAI